MDLLDPLVNTIVEAGFFVVLCQVLMLQASLAAYIPFLGTPISLFQFSLVYSLFIFDFRFKQNDSSMNQKLAFFNRHWIYFSGFGTPITLASSFVSFFNSSAIYALLLPAFLIMSLRATPLRQPRGSTALPERVEFATYEKIALHWVRANIASHFHPSTKKL